MTDIVSADLCVDTLGTRSLRVNGALPSVDIWIAVTVLVGMKFSPQRIASKFVFRGTTLVDHAINPVDRIYCVVDKVDIKPKTIGPWFQ